MAFPESTHPYGNNEAGYQSYSDLDTSATYLDVQFGTFSLASGDYVNILDASFRNVNYPANTPFTGTSLNGAFYRVWGSSFSIQLVSDPSGVDYGYKVIGVTTSHDVAIVTPNIAPGNVGTPYSYTLLSTGGTPGYAFAVVSGTLPAGLSIDALSGTISGTPTTAGTSSIIVQVTDTTPLTGRRAYDFIINDALPPGTTPPPDTAPPPDTPPPEETLGIEGVRLMFYFL